MIYIREEGRPYSKGNGVYLFHYGDNKLSGIFLKINKFLTGVRWDRPKDKRPKWYWEAK